MKTIRIYLTGSVQGVFFRKFLEDKANGLNVRGFCRNLEDGRVEVVVEGRGFEATTEGLVYPIPRGGTESLEVIYVQRAKNRYIRTLKQTLADLDVDTDVILKSALRGDIMLAHSEVGRFEEMPSIEDVKLRKRQEKAYMSQGEE